MTTGTTSSCSPAHPTPILEIHETEDGNVQYDGSAFATSIPDVLDYWTNYNNNNATPSNTALPNLDPTDGSTVEHIIYTDGDNGVNVEHFKIIGGDHTWPGNNFLAANQDIDASAEIWKFFSRYDIDGVIDPLSVDTFDKTALSIYPNPTKNFLTVKNEKFIETMDYNFVNVTGQIILVTHQYQILV